MAGSRMIARIGEIGPASPAEVQVEHPQTSSVAASSTSSSSAMSTCPS